MSNYREGQKVFAYVVVESDGHNPLLDGSKPEGKVLVEKRGRGEAYTYTWMGADGSVAHWHCRKAGRGFIRGESVEWDAVTKRQMRYLIDLADGSAA